MSELKLYNYFRSSTSYRIRIALNFKNIEFSYIPVHLLNNGGEQFTPQYKNLNPMSEVPTIDHDGLILGQSMAIIEYLEEQFPNPSLLPTDVHKRGKIRQFCENINSYLHPLSNLKVLSYLETHHSYSQQEKEKWIGHWYHNGLKALEQTVSKTKGQCCFGDQVTFADCFLIPVLFTAERFNVDLSPYPLLKQINHHCIQLTPFQKAHPFRQIDTPEQNKI